jgi:uncharacterized protein
MEKRILGRTGMEVSVIGFGGIPIQKLPFEEAATLLNRALDLEINFIDTARGYTDSEQKIGRALASRRGEFLLASKSMARDGEAMAEELETSLRELRTDCIDLYQLHALPSIEELDRVIAPGGAYDTLVKARQAGKIRFIGVTGHLREVLLRAVETDLFDTVQHPFNPIETEWAQDVIPAARARNVGLIGMKPAAGGAISNVPAALRFELTGLSTEAEPIDNHDFSGGMDLVIPGMDSLAQVEQNAEVGTSLRPPDPGEMTDLEADIQRWQGAFCRRCGYCMPCPEGLSIPFLLLIQAYYERYNLQEWARERLSGLEKKYDDCAACGHCLELCPYELKIPDLMAAAGKQVT